MYPIAHLESVNSGKITLLGRSNSFQVELESCSSRSHLEIVTLRLKAQEVIQVPEMELQWHFPLVDIQALWHPNVGEVRHLRPDWGQGFVSRATTGAPVLSFYNLAGKNRLTFACSDALRAVELSAGVIEEISGLKCKLRLFQDGDTRLKDLELQLRIDTRPLSVLESLSEVQKWWAQQPGYAPAIVPLQGKRPMYSTWYSFHQNLDRKRVISQCRLAKEYGCESVILDDGWQTRDRQRGYAYCGDWQPEGFTDLKEFVADVHALKMKCLLWYAVPFIGKHATEFPRLRNKLLSYKEADGHGVLDPRFPSVRAYLTQTYVRALEEWDLDGFKLDFVDALAPTSTPAECQTTDDEHRDFESVAEASDFFLSDVMLELRKRKPDVLIEFRQTYIGPLMRKYGNMLRAGDCPNDALNNRQRIMDIRLLAGETATHSDMIMWNREETPEVAARQFLNILFSVPQISVLLDVLPPSHQRMLRFWLSYWKVNVDVLLHGVLEVDGMEVGYRQVSSSKSGQRITALYTSGVVTLSGDDAHLWDVINVTGQETIFLEIASTRPVTLWDILDCEGISQSYPKQLLTPGLHRILVPPSGLARIRL